MNINLLKAKMVEKGITQGNLAKELGINENTMSSRMNGRTFFNTEEVTKMCRVLAIEDNHEKVSIFLA